MIDHLTPDLDNPILGLVVAALLAWGAVGILWLHDHRTAVARFRRRIRAAVAHLLGQSQDVRGHRPSPARLARCLHRAHGGRRRRDGARAAQPVALTDDEVVALARFLDLGWRVEWSGADLAALASAHIKLGYRADAVVFRERAGRR